MRKVLKFMRVAYGKIGISYAPPGTFFYFIHNGLRLIYVNYVLPALRQVQRNSVVKASEPTIYSVNFDINSVDSILIIKLDHIGDFIVALKAIEVIQSKFKDVPIDCICLPSVSVLASSTGIFRKVISFDAVLDSNENMSAELKPATDLARLINSEFYSLAIDFRHDPDTRMYMDVVKANVKAGFIGNTKSGLDICLPSMEWDVAPQNKPIKNPPVHASTRLLLLAYAIVDKYSEQIKWGCTYDASLKIGIGIGAGASTRKWSNLYWIQSIKEIAESLPCEFYFYGGNDDKIASSEIINSLPEVKCTNLVGALKLDKISQSMDNIHFFIGMDSGLTHIAASLDIPTLDIYPGVSNIPVWSAKGKGVSSIFVEVPCAPCHLRSIRDCQFNHICMTAIKPRDVAKHVISQLNLIYCKLNTH